MSLSKPYAALLALVVPTLLGVSQATVSPASAAGPSTYYFSPTGSDSASGRTAQSPWRSMSKLSALALQPGDHVRLRGGSYPGGVSLNYGGTSSAPVVVDSYGGSPARIGGSSGSCVTVRGYNLQISGIITAGCAYAGIEVAGDGVQIDQVESVGNEIGVAVDQSASYTRITGSYIHGNQRPAPGKYGPDDDSGAYGVLVLGDHTTIADNRINGHDIASPDYGRDGAGIEVFGGRSTEVSRNTATGNRTFIEVGGIPGRAEAAGLQVDANQVSSAKAGMMFMVIHAGDQFGAASGVRLVANRVDLSGPDTLGVAAGPKCTPSVLALSNNVIQVTERAMSVMGTYSSSNDRLSP